MTALPTNLGPRVAFPGCVGLRRQSDDRAMRGRDERKAQNDQQQRVDATREHGDTSGERRHPDTASSLR